ncbi:MAG: carbon-nitrogen hydrolase family protein [Pirellulales bacterium]|nr:carbon-nitrogen hydrolase family protein [Pirellulales bacterium]
MERLLAAAVQMNSQADPAANLAVAEALAGEAQRRGAQLVVLPEMFLALAPAAEMVAIAGEWFDRAAARLAALARRLQIVLVAGSIGEPSDVPGKIFNTSLVFDAQGERVASYRKLHLFDVDVPGRVCYRESDYVSPGDRLSVTETPLGKLGQSICYDLRFPELFRALVDRGAELLTVPSAFAEGTGRDHWEVLLRARALENQLFVIAANQHGSHPAGPATFGRSAIVDPWGTVLACAGDGVGLAIAEIDLARQASIRERLPALRHRRISATRSIDGAN